MGSDRFEYRDREPGDGNAHGGGGPMGRYEEMHGRSLADPEGFWGEAAMAIEWHRRWDSVLDHSSPPVTRGFVGGELQHCHNARDSHVEAGIGALTELTYG